ncbi:MAG TPA: DNA oxidative demethylase AlkB [Rhodanobacteraceae bacterium]|jgi:alkylated DNA repair protein (DNA oxidative demethylase)
MSRTEAFVQEHMVTGELFGAGSEPRAQPLGEGAVLLRGFALVHEHAILHALEDVIRAAPLRHMITPGGLRMSVAMSNCGALGWVSDRRGYRYSSGDPESGNPWPKMPDAFATLASDAAARAGFEHFAPDACLVNRYEPGAKLSLHQDRNERDFGQPIVSVSLGLPAVFLFGGLHRGDKPIRVPLAHGDVVVWGGPSRMRYHGVLPLKDGTHPQLGACRINLTFRKAG